MKKLLTSAAFLFLFGATSVFANDHDGQSKQISTSFRREFPAAQQVSWQNNQRYSVANFSLNNQVLFAYYMQNGDLITIVHNILTDHLPILLQTGLKNDYQGFWVTELFEAVTRGQSAYYVTLENADKKILLKSENGSSWNIEKESAK